MRVYVADTDALIGNIRAIKMQAGDAPVWAVLKGNGYGLGVVPLAKLLREQDVSRYCVTEVSEARALREAGFEEEHILMLQPSTDRDALEALINLNVICTISCQDDAVALNGVAGSLDTVAEAHIKIDTGMGRYGFRAEEFNQIAAIFQYMGHVAVSGIYTHFSSAFCSEKRTRAQFAAFKAILDKLADHGYETGEAHCCNSAALLRWPEMHMGGVRVGSALLGRLSVKGDFGLRRVGCCETKVIELHRLSKGERTGYGGAWKAKKDTRLAILPVGWYHGFGVEYGRDSFRFPDFVRGSLSLLKAWITRRKLYATVNGQRCPVRGHVGMLHCAVDVSKIECHTGDTAVLDVSPLTQKGMEIVFR